MLEAAARAVTGEGGTMSWAVNCECGETVRAEDEAGVIAGVTAHVGQRHPDLVGQLTDQQILGMAERV